jgi:arginyl-tRNA synthetase
VYDPQESVALVGNSGPYVQYAHARACSIMAKSGTADHAIPTDITSQEKQLALAVAGFSGAVTKALQDYMPHHICTYIYDLTQTFNAFYESNRVMGDARQSQRLGLVNAYQQVLQKSLGLLGMAAPDRM